MKLLREYIRVLLIEGSAPSYKTMMRSIPSADVPKAGSPPSYETSEYDDKLKKAFLNSAKQGAELAKNVGAGIAEPMQEVIDKIHQAYALRFDLQDKQVQEQDIDNIPNPWLRPNLWWNPRQEKIDENLRAAEDSFDQVFPPRETRSQWAIDHNYPTGPDPAEVTKLAHEFRKTTFVRGGSKGIWIVLAAGKNSRTRTRGRIRWLSKGIIKRFENLAEWAGIKV